MTSASVADPTFITFDAPDSMSTQPTSINDAGVVAGNFQRGINHGFLRTADGAFTTIHHGGRDVATIVKGLNNEGTVVGYDASNDTDKARGFFRTRDGAFKSFRVPGTPVTIPTGISSIGTITGYTKSYRSNNIRRGFLRTNDGEIILFDAARRAKWTAPLAINKNGTIVGGFEDPNSQVQGFIRNTDGTIITIELSGCSGRLSATAISGNGWIGGTCGDRGFVRAKDGTVTAFAASSDDALTDVSGINNTGVATGDYQDQSGTHGFVRTADGAISTFDVPGAYSTFSTGINADGVVAGTFIGGDNQRHGFIRTP